MTSKPLVGRLRERALIAKILKGNEPELVAVVGRRRVGKTFLIRECCRDHIRFEITGIHDSNRSLQLRNFSDQLAAAMNSRIRPEMPTDWYAAFQQLKQFLQSLKSKRRVVVFLDEVPWLASRRSGFLPALEHFWNSWASQQTYLVVIVCGSAASWMVDHVIHNRGGLYHRVTHHIHLQPFKLAEVQEFLESRNIRLEHRQIAELYMALGGVPHYLKDVQPGQSASQSIDNICFSPHGLLTDEFPHLFAALFENSDRHVNLIQALSTKSMGLTRNELGALANYPTGGRLTKILEELIQSGFVDRIDPWEKQKDALYRLTDEFSLFYLRWIRGSRGNRTGSEGAWLKRRGTPAWRAWSGYAFENICHRHLDEIKWGLGIAGVETQQGCWRHAPNSQVDEGAQIDLLIDRRDDVINICEAKFTDSEFVIDKRYAAELRRKLAIFRQVTQTRKSVLLTMITTFGVKSNRYSADLVSNELTLEALFRR